MVICRAYGLVALGWLFGGCKCGKEALYSCLEQCYFVFLRSYYSSYSYFKLIYFFIF